MNEKIMKDLTRLVGEKAPQSMAVYGGDFELVFVDILFKQVRPALPLHVPRTTQMIDTATTRCWPWWCSSRRTRAAGTLLVQKARPLRLPWVKPTSYCAIPTTGLGGAQRARSWPSSSTSRRRGRLHRRSHRKRQSCPPSPNRRKPAPASLRMRRKAVRRKMVRRKKKRKNLDVGTRTRRNLRQAVMMPRREVGAGAEEACQVAARECSA
mmetsp:Transcript_25219/g.81576  ORF Transcript_25219/g.81576 Transcript_25219/m.81576 type:complete len:210 (+) Transcript_25219:980-1609(+)